MGFVKGNTSVCSNHGNGVQISWTHTVASGSNILIVTAGAACAVSGQTGVLSATYNGVAMTKKIEKASSSSGYWFNAAIFYLLNPPAGAHTVVVTTNFAPQFAEGSAGAIDLAGADSVQNGSTNTGASSSLAVSSSPGDFCVDCLCAWTAGGSVTPTGSGQVEIWDYPNPGYSFSHASSYIEPVSGSSVTFGWTISGSVEEALAGAAFKPVYDSEFQILSGGA